MLVHTPIISSNDCEGGGETFTIQVAIVVVFSPYSTGCFRGHATTCISNVCDIFNAYAY